MYKVFKIIILDLIEKKKCNCLHLSSLLSFKTNSGDTFEWSCYFAFKQMQNPPRPNFPHLQTPPSKREI